MSQVPATCRRNLPKVLTFRKCCIVVEHRVVLKNSDSLPGKIICHGIDCFGDIETQRKRTEALGDFSTSFTSSDG